MDYPHAGEVVPGSFDHRSGDCPEHGSNVVFARPARSQVAFECVACLLSAVVQTPPAPRPPKAAPVSHAMFIRLSTNRALTGSYGRLSASKVGAAMDAFANLQLALVEDADCPDRFTTQDWYPDGK